MMRKAFGVLAILLMATPLLAVPPEGRPGRKNRDCAHQCRAALRSCNQDVRDAFRTCTEASCAAESEAAIAACEADPQSEECAAAREAFDICRQPCADTAKEDRRSCRATTQLCIVECPDRQVRPTPNVPDPACVAACRDELSSCTSAAHDAAGACNDSCGGLITAATEACAAAPGRACAAARHEANRCLHDCGRQVREGAGNCSKAAHLCGRACRAS
ncbi:MAG TPA: hypothetical protein VEB21_05895 [Terriglobales bacterium]|nr:hypothetical protein [Terriglobales bacterium]